MLKIAYTVKRSMSSPIYQLYLMLPMTFTVNVIGFTVYNANQTELISFLKIKPRIPYNVKQFYFLSKKKTTK